MPSTTVIEEIELIIADLGGGGGQRPPSGDENGHGDSGKPRGRGAASKRYTIAIGLAMTSILMFFLTMVVVFLVLERTNTAWVPVHLPSILWGNTLVLLASSLTLELACNSLADANLAKFQMF